MIQTNRKPRENGAARRAYKSRAGQDIGDDDERDLLLSSSSRPVRHTVDIMLLYRNTHTHTHIRIHIDPLQAMAYAIKKVC